ncbi:D-alanine--D-alanine ligase [Natroniella sulfidigena]|uniref:D-alanine--D-alanine ligase n=1 Tax=Natroniella sulfidigena TaxID=723921 RepID=UPI00200AD3E1|nr:D-alanine--D-alanine ligase [Natroniella sulfidigena]MCK8818176.1 D-alanine--D-alanine ligase [Natroniella sulfidigena]
MTKTRVGVLFGGKSAEHEVSLQSAKNVIEAMDQEKYEIVLIGMDKQGRWYLKEDSDFLLNATDPTQIKLSKSDDEVALILGDGAEQLININDFKILEELDVVFPILHGPYGEDGTVQGLFKLVDLPFVGADVLGSAVGMDKDVMKRLLRDAGIPIADFLTYHHIEQEKIDFAEIKDRLDMPVFIKPANLGSSVGISKAANQAEFEKAIELAFQFDNKIIIEEAIEGREIECSVLGNQKPIASVPGEILPQEGFYSYEAKYIDESGAALEMPAKLADEMVKKVQECAVESFKVLCCQGMARVDVFVQEDQKIIVNEINTIPGFTKISMYPKLWELSGISYSELIDKLIELAIERYNNEKKLKTSFEFEN